MKDMWRNLIKAGTPIAEGNTAKLYLWENKIIKVFNDYLPEMEAVYEANKQKLACSLGITVPKVLDVTMIEGNQAIIMEYVKGKTIGSLAVQNLNNVEYYLDISVDVQRGIHSVLTDSFEPMSMKLKRQIELTGKLDEKLKKVLIGKLESMSYEKRLCHGDFHLFNLIDSNKKVTIIDWVDSSAGDIRADVCRTYLLYLEESIDLAEIYLRIYCMKSGLSKEEILQWVPIIAGARLSEHITKEKSSFLLGLICQ